ncbi:MAG: bifunctional DNA primase/polymerase [Desulfomonilaceae bacterium]
MSNTQLSKEKQRQIASTEDRPALLLQAALEYATRGLAVFPLYWIDEHGNCACGKPDCGSDGGKHPLWDKRDLLHGYLNATTNPEQIRTWWDRWPLANIGIATGRKSGLIVIDVDPRKGGDESYGSLKETHGLPVTVTALTGGGGWHDYLRPENGIGFTCKTDMWPGIDIKADGGYVVAPPSNHISGHTYQWEDAYHPNDLEIAAVPVWMAGLLPKKTETTDTAQHQTPRKEGRETLKGQESARYTHQIVKPNIPIGEPIPKGQRKVTLFAYATSFRDDTNRTENSVLGILLGINAKWCKPPLEEKVVKARVVSAFKKKERRRPCRKRQLYLDEGPMKVHAYLWSEAMGMNWIRLSFKKIAAATGLSERHVSTCIKTLEEWVLLDVIRGSGKGRTSSYLPKPPRQQQSEKDEVRMNRLNSPLMPLSDSKDLSSLTTCPPPRKLSLVK